MPRYVPPMPRNDQGRRFAKTQAAGQGHDVGNFRWHEEPLGSMFPGGAYVARCSRPDCPLILAQPAEQGPVRWLRLAAAATSSGPAGTIPACPNPETPRPPRRVPASV